MTDNMNMNMNMSHTIQNTPAAENAQSNTFTLMARLNYVNVSKCGVSLMRPHTPASHNPTGWGKVWYV